jgi:hypothetical protein
MIKQKTDAEYVHIGGVDWQPLPEGFAIGGGKWKLLHVSPEMGSWSAMFSFPKGASVAKHIHVGPGEYFLTKGKLEVRGGEMGGGDKATAPGYGYEPCNAQHDQTDFLEDSEIYMSFLGPLQILDDDDNTIGVLGWEQAQGLWAEQTG